MNPTTEIDSAEAVASHDEIAPIPPDDGASLRTEGLVKEYGGRRVVDEVSIYLKRGEIVGLLGPNGAGKTTTFNMVVGIVKPLAGRVVLEGEDITGQPLYKRARKGLGYLSQETSVFRKLTVEDNILAVLQVMGLNRSLQRERLDELLVELGITHKAKDKAHTCSGGERRRLEIARALAGRPLYMLLDEPFSGVDPRAVEEIQGIIRQLRDSGLGILITDHSVRETLTVTDRSYIIHDGVIRVAGSMEDIVSSETAKKLYLGEDFYIQVPGGGVQSAGNGGSSVDRPTPAPHPSAFNSPGGEDEEDMPRYE